MIKTSILVLLLLSSPGFSSELEITVGTGVLIPKDRLTDIKTLHIAITKPLGKFRQKFSAGLIIDTYPGRSSSFTGFYSLGMRVDPGYGVFAETYVGAGLISHPDSRLGGHFQFKEDFLFGLMDHKNRGYAIQYSHISSASIYDVNLGRDLLQFTIKIPLD